MLAVGYSRQLRDDVKERRVECDPDEDEVSAEYLGVFALGVVLLNCLLVGSGVSADSAASL